MSIVLFICTENTGVDEPLLNRADVVVAMGMEHKVYVEKKFGRRVHLFNKIARGEETSMEMDPSDARNIDEKLRRLADAIREAIPRFVEHVPQFVEASARGGGRP